MGNKKSFKLKLRKILDIFFSSFRSFSKENSTDDSHDCDSVGYIEL